MIKHTTSTMPVFGIKEHEKGTCSGAYILNANYEDNLYGVGTEMFGVEEVDLADFSFYVQNTPDCVCDFKVEDTKENISRVTVVYLHQDLPVRNGLDYLKRYNEVLLTGSLVGQPKITHTEPQSNILNFLQGASLKRTMGSLKIQREIKSLMKELLHYQELKEYRRATGLIFDNVGRIISQGNFSYLSSYMGAIPFDSLNGKLLVAFLSITNPWKEEVLIKQKRKELLLKTEECLLAEVGQKRTEVILKGLK